MNIMCIYELDLSIIKYMLVCSLAHYLNKVNFKAFRKTIASSINL